MLMFKPRKGGKEARDLKSPENVRSKAYRTDILPTESDCASRKPDDSPPGQAAGQAIPLIAQSKGQLAVNSGENKVQTTANVSPDHDNSTNEESRDDLETDVPNGLVLCKDATGSYYLRSENNQNSFRLNSSAQLVVSFGPQVGSVLCAECQRFNIQSAAKKPRVLYVDAVRGGDRDNGCAFCALLLRHLQIKDHLFLHMWLGRPHDVTLLGSKFVGLRINHLTVTATDRYLQHAHPHTVEFGIAADHGTSSLRLAGEFVSVVTSQTSL